MNLCDVIVRNIGENKHILLVGDGGAGKTYQFVDTFKNIVDISINNNAIIPLYIPMNEFNNTENFIRNYIISEYIGETEMVENVIARNKLKGAIEKKDYRFCIFIDSIDETSTLTDKALSEIIELSKWKNVTIIFSCRNNIEHLPNFEVYKISPLNDELLEKEVEDYHTLNQKLKDLIKIPFHYKKYIEIKKDDKKKITSEAELLDLYYEWILEKTYESIDRNTYHDDCESILREFLPTFAYEQMNKIIYMLFEYSDIREQWDLFKKECNISIIDNFIDVLEKFGIICKNGRKKYSFSHQNIYTYFAAKYIVDKIEAEQGEGDRLLNQVSDVYILRMIGELLGEHRHIHKCNCNDAKSRVEEKLDKYRGHFEDNLSPKMVDKYIQIMKLCRENRCCADLSNLNLVNTTLYDADWSGSNFSSSVFSQNSFKNPSVLSNIYKNFLYYDEKNKIIVATDYKKMVLFDNWFNIITIIEFDKILGSTIDIYENGMIISKFISKSQTQKTYSFSNKEFVEFLMPSKLLISFNCEFGILQRDKDIINPKDFFMCDIFDSEYQLWENDAYQHKDNKYRVFSNGEQIALGVFEGDFEGATINVENLDDVRFSKTIAKEYFKKVEDLLYIRGRFYFESNNIICIDGNYYDVQERKIIQSGRNKYIRELYGDNCDVLLISNQFLVEEYNRIKLMDKLEVFKQLIDDNYHVYTVGENIYCAYDATRFITFNILDNDISQEYMMDGSKIVLGSVYTENNNVKFLTAKDNKIYFNMYSLKEKEYVCKGRNVENFIISEGVLNCLLDYEIAILASEKFTTQLHMNKEYIIYNDFFRNLCFYSFKAKKSYVLNLNEYGVKGIVEKFQLNADSVIIVHETYHDRRVSKITISMDSDLNFEKKWTIQLLDNISIAGCNFDNCTIVDFNGDIKNIPEELLNNT